MLAPHEVLVASVNGVFGVRGEVRLFVYDRQSRTLAKPRLVILISPAGERRDALVRVRSGAGKRIIAEIEGVTTPEMASAMNGWHLVVPRAELPPAGDGEYYVHDLLELPVFEGEEQVGKLVDVVAGARDIWVIEGPAGEERYVLAGPETVLAVELGVKILLVAGASSAAE